MTEARILKGFRDALPLDEIRRNKMTDIVKTVFSSFGYAPIDTPCLEYEDILLSKSAGETEKQIYAFEDNGKRRVALRFDLTVPFARFVAMHVHKEIELPFKRYHIAKVWRGENSQAGRYREFYQCDVDIVGSDSARSDAEIIEAIGKAIIALCVGDFNIHISHRGLLKGILEDFNLSEKSTEVLRLLDKIAKIGKEKTEEGLLTLVGDKNKVRSLIDFVSSTYKAEELAKQTDYSKISPLLKNDNKSILRLKEILKQLDDEILSKIVIDFSITRGLDYYTGFVFETFLKKNREVGSIASGGRYDNLTAHFIKESITGVGGSIGLDRLLSTEGKATKESSADLYIATENSASLSPNFISKLRKGGLRVDVAFEERKNNQIYKYVEMNNIPYILFVKKDSFVLKTVATRKEDKFENIKDLEKAIASTIVKDKQ